MAIESYYDAAYYQWQEAKGQFGGIAELIKFQPYIEATDRVIDFGCGGGFLLADLACRDKIGIEINPPARQGCAERGIQAVATIGEVADFWADKIISNHALEHVSDPLATIMALKQKLKPGGIFVCVVPCERVDTRYVPGNVDQHLYTWSPMNLGTLFAAAGYDVVESRAFLHRWLPKFAVSQRILGWTLFHRASWLYGFLFRKLSQVRVVAMAR